MMKKQFEALLDLIKEPLRSGGLKTDNSIRFIYPPEEELNFREYLVDTFVPLLETKGIPVKLLDLRGFLFETMAVQDVKMVQEDEFDDYGWMKQGLSKRVEGNLQKRFAAHAEEFPGETLIVHGTIALYPLIRFGEVLKGARDLNCRIVITHPGEERDGKSYFMNQPDSGNYLTVKLT
jgi:hypothetical protein